MKDKATLIAVSGVVAIGIGLIFLAGFSGKTIDTELIKQLVTGLMGFAGGVSSGIVATVSNKVKE